MKKLIQLLSFNLFVVMIFAACNTRQQYNCEGENSNLRKVLPSRRSVSKKRFFASYKLEQVISALARGADVNVSCAQHPAPLIVAAYSGYLNLAKVLIKHGADVNIEDNKGNGTALHIAACNDYIDIAALLIKEGADLESKDTYDNTPLHLAATNGSIGVTRLLLEQEAQVDIQSRGGYTPLMLAITGYTPQCSISIEDRISLVETLVDATQDLNLKTDEDKTALAIADEMFQQAVKLEDKRFYQLVIDRINKKAKKA